MARVLMVASEAAPYMKTGGLGDVLGSLPPALARLGDEVAVVLPRYRGIGLPRERVWDNLPIHAGPFSYYVGIDQVIRQGVRFLFVDCPVLYDRDGVYADSGGDYNDNHIRFSVLCRAAIDVARYVFRPDVFHAHDWQAGLLPVYLRENFRGDPTFLSTPSIFTIHNLGYQGYFPGFMFADLALARSVFHSEGLEFYGGVSFMKAGVVWSDAVTTVSPTYAREIQTPEYGFNMDGLLRSRAYKLSGILNGADYSEWNPETDNYILANYSARDVSSKRACKLDLLKEMGLPADPDRPLIGIISRMAHQKGMDLAAEIVPWLVSQDAALVALGSGEPGLEGTFRAMQDAHPDRVAVRIGYNEGLAHRIEAGTDMFLMPSRYEPCGLNQMYSLRYGSVPVVRATGGLEDTVDAYTGFKFGPLSAGDVIGAMSSALDAFKDREAWNVRMRLGMSKDFSWDASAREYHRLYESARARMTAAGA
jgi:starch synthase